MQDFRANETKTVSGQVRRTAVDAAAYVGLDVHKDPLELLSSVAALFYIIGKPSSDKRLIRHVTFIGFNFNAVQ